MSPRSTAASLLLGVWSVCQYLLLSGSPILTEPLLTSLDMPLGTIVAWSGLLALPTSLLLARPGWLGHAGTRAMQATVLLAAVWGFACYGLANNWSFRFAAGADGFRGSAAAGRLFWWYSVSVWAAPLLIVISAAAFRLVSALRR